MDNQTPITPEQIKQTVNTGRELGRAVLPPDLAAIVDQLKIGRSLLHALGSIEQVAWEEHFPAVEDRAEAFILSAMIYGDLSDSGFEALDEHVRKRVATRRALLKEKLDEQA